MLIVFLGIQLTGVSICTVLLLLSIFSVLKNLLNLDLKQWVFIIFIPGERFLFRILDCSIVQDMKQLLEFFILRDGTGVGQHAISSSCSLLLDLQWMSLRNSKF